jgi:hypothetical protein
MGVQLFGGKFSKCVYVNKHDRVKTSENVKNKIDCLNENLTWENSRLNFDHVLNGYLSLFQMLSRIFSKEIFSNLINRQHSKVGLKSWRMQPMRKKSMFNRNMKQMLIF